MRDSHFKDKIILVTGGTGSFGNALIQRIFSGFEFGEVRVFSRDELKQSEMREKLKDPRVKFFLGDVRDRQGLDFAMKNVDYVFHAAALKQVPSCEFFPMQAVMTNVIGSHNVIQSAIANGVSKLICLSTDKAVYPINAMGMSKALMERIAAADSRTHAAGKTIICSVRYGNVMCSRGSVIPLFVEQIRAKAPLTITAPEMTRFLLPLDYAIDLVIYAFEHGRPGDLFIRKAPASTIADLAEALKRLYHSSVPIRTIGVRHGEKLHETLATRAELQKADESKDYFRVPMDERDLNYDNFVTHGKRPGRHDADYTSDTAERLGVPEVERLLRSLPELKLPSPVE